MYYEILQLGLTFLYRNYFNIFIHICSPFTDSFLGRESILFVFLISVTVKLLRQVLMC